MKEEKGSKMEERTRNNGKEMEKVERKVERNEGWRVEMKK